MTDPPERLPPERLRASDADRERVAAVLRDAAAEGRLDLEELTERLGAVYAARTYAELEPLTADLPATASAPVRFAAGAPAPLTGPPPSRGGIAVMGEFRRTGPWVVPRLFQCLAFWGGGRVDLREARIVDGEVRIRAFAIMGGIEIVVPEDAEVHVTGLGVMGGFHHGASGAGAPGAPRIMVSGLAFWGGVEVKRRPPAAEWKRRKRERRQQHKLHGTADEDD